MMRGRFAALLGATMLCASAARADDYIPPVVGGQTYVQHQIMVAKARHPEISSIVVEGVREGSDDVVILGSTLSAAKVFTPGEKRRPGAGWASNRKLYVVREPYNSNSRHPIGTITIAFHGSHSAGTARFRSTADHIAAQMARATLSPKNAADPWPYDAKFGPTTYAQTLVDRLTAKHPDLLVMMIHATPPGGDKNVIIGSNIGRFGKTADEDDARVIDKGETNLEVGGDKDRFETELPLNDASGKRIGALGLVFGLKPADDHEMLHKHGLAIRDELARDIPNSAALFRKR